MGTPILSNSIYKFGLFEVDPSRATLLRQGKPIKLQEQPMRVLCILLERAGKTVTRDELRQQLWPDGTFVQFDGSLNAALKKLRSALGDDANNPTFIETVPKLGYLFIAPVQIDAGGGLLGEKDISEASQAEAAQASKLYSETGKRFWLGAIALGILAVIAVAIFFVASLRKISSQPTISRPVIAVLPFRNLGAGADFDYLSYALANELVTDLSHVHSLSVRPFSSSSIHGTQPVDPATVGQELRVTHVLAGGFLLDKQQLRLDLELVDVARNEPVWRDELIASPEHMVALDSELANHAATGLLAAINYSASLQTPIFVPRNEHAFRLYLHSLAISRDPGPNREAIKNLEDSVALDNEYAPAWEELAWRYYIDYTYGDGGSQERTRGTECFKKLMQLDPNGTANQITIKTENGNLEGAYDEAADLLHRWPDKSGPHYEMSYVLRYAGLLDEAKKECAAALAIDPGYSAYRSCAIPFVLSGDYGGAEQYIGLDQNTGFAAMLRLQIALRAGNGAAALSQTGSASESGFLFAKVIRAFLGHARDPDLNRAIAEMEGDPRLAQDSEAFYRNAEALAYIGRGDAALQQLRSAVHGNYCSYPALDTDPIFDPVRQNGQFSELRVAAIQCQQKLLNHRRDADTARTNQKTQTQR